MVPYTIVTAVFSSLNQGVTAQMSWTEQTDSIVRYLVPQALLKVKSLIREGKRHLEQSV